jgi:hypothetical protein
MCRRLRSFQRGSVREPAADFGGTYFVYVIEGRTPLTKSSDDLIRISLQSFLIAREENNRSELFVRTLCYCVAVCESCPVKFIALLKPV